MNRFSWWHIAVGVTLVAMAAVAATDFAESPTSAIGAWVCLGVLAVGYVLFGWRGFIVDYDECHRTSLRALAFPVLAIVCTSVGVGFNPSLATLQAIAFPIIWFTVDPLRRAIILNVVLAAGVTIGFLFSTGTSARAIAQAITIEAISLLFSLALGLWFSFALKQGQENTRLLAELQATQHELAVLNRDSGILSERERLAGEIHDTIAQSLTGLVMVAQRASRAATDDQPSVKLDLTLIEDIAREALVETRALVAAGTPVAVDGGLPAALTRLNTRFTRETGVAITLTTEGYHPEPNEVEVVLLRSAQEALANVRKHSHATRVTMRLATTGSAAAATSAVVAPSDGARLRIVLSVGDDGTGIDASRPLDDGFGLSGMQQRLALLGGELAIGPSGQGGVELTVSLPSLAERVGS
ncbi:sensor histidine kinase [Subtercola sp. PAMC28395]|uniref:sensor histidine kinase n=1 Tax=Subtercola sp. PAMC28395 TaxID=2846775 RepID=UPI001C0C3B1B|nr:sensor histidine kinase [Subtercola sp. PAMC28395]QWT24300.1 sensor histidine kinase [Subtercola sp. PAMC28395]